MTTTTSLQSVTAGPAITPLARTPADLLWLSSPVRYSDVWDLQMRLHRERVMDLRPDTVLVLEHQPVYTIGRRTQVSDWGGDPTASHRNGIDIQHVNRGGSVTYHGPGQLVLYPILRLTHHARGIRAYVERLEEAVILCLRQNGIAGHRKEKAPGVWVADPHEAKIAAIGIRVDRGVTMHGIALNVDMDLSPFRAITPCGLAACQVTSMAEVLARPVSIDAVKRMLVEQFMTLWALDWTESMMRIDSHGCKTSL